MPNTITTYSDEQIMRCLLTHDFTAIGKAFTDDVVTKIKAGAFYQAANLDEVHLPALKEVGDYAFYDTDITTLDLPWTQLESIGFCAFREGFSALPLNLTLSKVTVLGNGAFAGTSSNKNTQLRTVSLPMWTGSGPSTVGFSGAGGIFGYCSALTEVTAPQLTTIPANAFQYCAALEEVAFPKVTSIGSSAFDYCSKLKKIDIGGAVTAIGSSFLGSVTLLETIILRGVTAVPTLGSNVFNNTNISRGTAYIYVPRSLLATFQVAANWSTYTSQLRAIEDYPDVCGS